MTREALEKEAYQYDAEHLRDNGIRWYHNVTIRQAYLAGAEPREKRITELEKQIEKLKKDLREIKNNYDKSKDKTPIPAFGAEYRLFCDIENILEEW